VDADQEHGVHGAGKTAGNDLVAKEQPRVPETFCWNASGEKFPAFQGYAETFLNLFYTVGKVGFEDWFSRNRRAYHRSFTAVT